MCLVHFLLLCLTAFSHVGDVYRCVYDGAASNQSFAITAKVSCVMAADTDCGNLEFAVEDDRDAVNLFYASDTNGVPVPGDTILAHGAVKRRWDGKCFAQIAAYEVLARSPAPPPRQTTVREMTEGRVDCRYCRLHATIRETAQNKGPSSPDLHIMCIFT